jgi:hypothetical protein
MLAQLRKSHMKGKIMEQNRQEDREQGNEPHDFKSFPARDYNRWANLFEALVKLGITPKVEVYKQATDFLNENPDATIDSQLQKLLEIVGSYAPLVEAEAYLLVKGLETVPFQEIATSTDRFYLCYMSDVLVAGELAAQRLQAAMDDYQSQRISASGQNDAQPEAAKLSEQQSTEAVDGASPKEDS